MAQVKRSCSSLADRDWNLWVDEDPEDPRGLTLVPDRIQIVLQWEILQELKRLNGLLQCRNFTQVPATLRGIRRDLKGKGK